MANHRLERLLNLIALLSDTKKALTLQEIVQTIPGYPESKSASQRAFLRDKDDLKAMNFDVVLEDTPIGEKGYLIRSENTYYDLKLSAAQRSIVEYALALYGPEKQLAQNAVTKLGGLNPENDIREITSLPLPKFVDDLFSYIGDEQTLEIVFRGTLRRIKPLKIIAKSGYWYIQALDLEKKESRTFRIDRIENVATIDSADIELLEMQTVPLDESEMVNFKVRVHPALMNQFLKQWSGKKTEISNEVQFKVPRKELFISRLFEYSGFVTIVEPIEIASEVSDQMQSAINSLKAAI